MALFGKKPEKSGGGNAGQKGQWLRLGPGFEPLRVLFQKSGATEPWDSPAFKAYEAYVTRLPVELLFGPDDRGVARVVYVVSGGRASMHGFHAIQQVSGRENLRRLSGQEGIGARHFTPQMLEAIQRLKAQPQPQPAAKPAADAKRPVRGRPVQLPRRPAATDLGDFSDLSEPSGDQTQPSAPAAPKAEWLGGEEHEQGEWLGGPDPAQAGANPFDGFEEGEEGFFDSGVPPAQTTGRAPGEPLPGEEEEPEEIMEADLVELEEVEEVEPAAAVAEEGEWFGGPEPDPNFAAEGAADLAGTDAPEGVSGESFFPGQELSPEDLAGGEAASTDGEPHVPGHEADFGADAGEVDLGGGTEDQWAGAADPSVMGEGVDLGEGHPDLELDADRPSIGGGDLGAGHEFGGEELGGAEPGAGWMDEAEEVEPAATAEAEAPDLEEAAGAPEPVDDDPFAALEDAETPQAADAGEAFGALDEPEPAVAGESAADAGISGAPEGVAGGAFGEIQSEGHAIESGEVPEDFEQPAAPEEEGLVGEPTLTDEADFSGSGPIEEQPAADISGAETEAGSGAAAWSLDDEGLSEPEQATQEAGIEPRVGFGQEFSDEFEATEEVAEAAERIDEAESGERVIPSGPSGKHRIADEVDAVRTEEDPGVPEEGPVGLVSEVEEMAERVAEEPVPVGELDMGDEEEDEIGLAEDLAGGEGAGTREPGLGERFAHDDIQYLEGLEDQEAPAEAVHGSVGEKELAASAEEPVSLGDEEIVDAEAYLHGDAATESGEVDERYTPVSTDEDVERALKDAEAAEPEIVDAEQMFDFSSDNDIRQALDEAGEVVMTPVEPDESGPAPATEPPAGETMSMDTPPAEASVSGAAGGESAGPPEMPPTGSAEEASEAVGLTEEEPSINAAVVTAAEETPEAVKAAVAATEPAPSEPVPDLAEGGGALEWIPFTKENSDALKAQAKEAGIAVRQPDRMIFNLPLAVRFPEGEQKEGRLCLYERRPSLLVEGEDVPRAITRKCAIAYIG